MRGEKTGDAMGAMYSIVLYGNDRAKMEGARDTKVDAEAIHQQNGLNPSVYVRKAAGAFVGQLGKLRPIVNRPDVALAPDGGGSQPPRRLPACPTSRQRFHFYVVHPQRDNEIARDLPNVFFFSGILDLGDHFQQTFQALFAGVHFALGVAPVGFQREGAFIAVLERSEEHTS